MKSVKAVAYRLVCDEKESLYVIKKPQNRYLNDKKSQIADDLTFISWFVILYLFEDNKLGSSI